MVVVLAFFNVFKLIDEIIRTCNCRQLMHGELLMNYTRWVVDENEEISMAGHYCFESYREG
ncbi:hypothetical protein DEO72_LG8g2135 [Vigna unguiculata]|uniref:Uncharacterized protein n=1 Tax=Vigna unguiculata TaxID=3917 RepID=A0A4D6MU23_VIGUN|nr:hypothetical protein DEO72_LG8g2135 [Vigna unguiculata]